MIILRIIVGCSYLPLLNLYLKALIFYQSSSCNFIKLLNLCPNILTTTLSGYYTQVTELA